MKEYGGLELHQKGNRTKILGRGAKPKGLKPKGLKPKGIKPKGILFKNFLNTNYITFYPNFLKFGTESPSGVKASS
jgi:hypothetical protein